MDPSRRAKPAAASLLKLARSVSSIGFLAGDGELAQHVTDRKRMRQQYGRVLARVATKKMQNRTIEARILARIRNGDTMATRISLRIPHTMLRRGTFSRWGHWALGLVT